jgi:hypothetical protein
MRYKLLNKASLVLYYPVHNARISLRKKILSFICIKKQPLEKGCPTTANKRAYENSL